MPSGKIKLKISFLGKEFPNCPTKSLRISEQTVPLVVSLTSKGLSQPIPSWAGPSEEACVSLKAARKKPCFLPSACIHQIHHQFPRDLGAFHHLLYIERSQDQKNSPCSRKILVQLQSGSAGCSFDALPVVASSEEARNESRHRQREFANLDWNVQMERWGFSRLLCHLPPCTAIPGNRTLPRRWSGKGETKMRADVGRVCQPQLCPKNWGKRVLRDWKDRWERAP